MESGALQALALEDIILGCRPVVQEDLGHDTCEGVLDHVLSEAWHEEARLVQKGSPAGILPKLANAELQVLDPKHPEALVCQKLQAVSQIELEDGVAILVKSHASSRTNEHLLLSVTAYGRCEVDAHGNATAGRYRVYVAAHNVAVLGLHLVVTPAEGHHLGPHRATAHSPDVVHVHARTSHDVLRAHNLQGSLLPRFHTQHVDGLAALAVINGDEVPDLIAIQNLAFSCAGEVLGQRASDVAVVYDACVGRLQRRVHMHVWLQLRNLCASQDAEVLHSVGNALLVQQLNLGVVLLCRRANQLAHALVGDALLLGIRVDHIRAFHTALGHDRAGLVVHAGVDDTAVVP
mmetsp:Transcript_5252/g.14534  ORF Transcript_5252/g.14534 Transcript_5252/m.14534 type:complete len:348 (-) Transcript_5252:364-1407(-)